MTYRYPSQQAATASLAVIDQELRTLATQRGYTVLPEGIVGKNALVIHAAVRIP